MTDQTPEDSGTIPEEQDPPVPAPVPRPRRLNRIVAVLATLLSLVLALLPVIADLDLTSTASIIAGIAAVLTVTLKWLDGWQQFEKAGYQFDLTAQQANAQLAVMAAEEEAAGRIGGIPAKPRVAVPGR